MSRFAIICALCGICCASTDVFAQQVTVSTPLQNISERFFESSNIGWNFSGPGVFATFGNSTSGRPPFGGFDPNAGLSSGMSINAGGFTSNFLFNFSQGIQRTHITTAPKATTFNGVPVFLTDQVQRPFVTSIVPIVNSRGPLFPNFGAANAVRGRMLRGEFSIKDGKIVPAGGGVAPRIDRRGLAPDVPVTEFNNNSIKRSSSEPINRAQSAFEHLASRQHSTTAAVSSVVKRRQQTTTQSASQLQAALKYYKRGQIAEEKGKAGVAKINYRMAASRTSGDFKQRILERLKSVDAKK